MDDIFRKFIMEHREEFDFREPDPGIWGKVASDIRIKRKTDWQIILKRAAVIVLIFMVSYAANELVHRMNGKVARNEKSKGSKDTLPGLREAEVYYTTIVNQKLDELKPIIANCPSLEAELNFDLSELDSVYYELKTDLKDNIANQEVVEAIIENYRLKIRILEDVLSEMDPLEDECVSNSDLHAL